MPPVAICSRRFNHVEGHPEVTYEVLVDGRKFICDETQLGLLYDGVDPADLDLEELE